MKNRVILALLLALLMCVYTPAAMAAEVTEDPESEQTTQPSDAEEVIEIHTVADLSAMAQDPSGSYILMEDLDMTGEKWLPLEFSGKLNGNGHAIVNLSLSQPGETTADTYDGNKKAYDTTMVGLFSVMKNAEVKDLKLINVRALVESDQPCFLAGIAGYMEQSVISGCTVTGTLELRAFDRMFGVAGVVGYGGGSIENCQVDVTLICTDTDSKTRDEQFMGGVYATGFIDVKDCQITIDGYCSEYGYVHNGGIVGMYMFYPMGEGKTGTITGNSVTGKITFFECNTDRRAYCKAYAGEILANKSKYELSDNTEEFVRDERKEYDVELRPEMCAEPSYTEVVTDPGCDTYGYTTYTCDTCGYSDTDCYTLFRHTVTQWTVTVEPTTESEGLSIGYCDGCGKEFQQMVEKLEPVPTEEPTEAPTEEPTEAPTESVPEKPMADSSEDTAVDWILFVPVILAVLALILILLLLPKKRRKTRKGKFLK